MNGRARIFRCRFALANLLCAALLLLSSSTAWGYRPFVSTDAAVADIKELEVELGKTC